MKLKRRIGIGLAVAAATYCVLAYIFMWWPVVTYHDYRTGGSPCINNLTQIDAAIHQWALENNKHDGDAVTFAEIKPYLKLDASGEIPSCPSGGKYSVSIVGQAAICSLGTTTHITNKLIRVRVGYFHWTWSDWSCWNFGSYHRAVTTVITNKP